MKKCKACGRELPENSVFCQYCGSEDIIDAENEKQKIFCYDCGKELPEGSNFCQYCGSKNIGNNINDVKHSNIEPEKKKSFSGSLAIIVVLSLMAATFGYGTYYYQKQLKMTSDSLNATISFLSNQLDDEKTKSYEYKNKYQNVMSISNQNIYPDFRADTYVVRGTNQTIKIFCGINAQLTINPEVTLGSGIGWEWGEWTGSGYYHYCPMYITCSSGSSGIITFTNTYNNHKFKVYVTSD